MVELGLAYELGRGISQNYKEAIRWYRAAMERDNPHAAYCYADMLEKGIGVEKNPAEIVRCYKIAADAGHGKAQLKYGLILEEGLFGMSKNMNEAVRYYKMASDQRYLQGMFFYAGMLEHGKGVRQDMAEAVKLYRRAAEKNHMPAVGHYGYLLAKGNGVRQNVQEGLRLLEYAGKNGNVASWIQMGILHEESNRLTEAFGCYQKAAEMGHGRDLLYYARCLAEGLGCSQNQKKAEELYQQILEETNDPEAMFRLGRLKVSRKGVRKDVERGWALIEQAASLGHEKAILTSRRGRKETSKVK
jgi:TPR repeat protein